MKKKIFLAATIRPTYFFFVPLQIKMRKIRALEVIGICLLSILLFKMTVRNVSWIRTILTRQPDLQRRYNGGYAVITGASSGIGKYIAYELAQRKFKKPKLKAQDLLLLFLLTLLFRVMLETKSR